MAAAIANLPPKPNDQASAPTKKAYSEALSNAVARAIGQELRERGLKEARPAPPGALDGSGAERRMSGGIGAKKVDVTWATEESGLILGISIKSISFRDGKSGNFQKNLTNRRGDMLFEGVTLHRRFPYAVLGGLIFLDAEAAKDGTSKRRSTFLNAHSRFKLFTGRDDPGGRDEQYEHLFVILVDATSSPPLLRTFAVGDPDGEVSMDDVLQRLLESIALRNPDFYEVEDGKLRSVNA
jgi:hypothetical protein